MMMNFKKAAFIVILFVFVFVFLFLFISSSKIRKNHEELCKQLVYRRNKSEHYYPSQVPFFLNQFFDTFIWTVINKIPPTPWKSKKSLRQEEKGVDIYRCKLKIKELLN